MKLIILVYLGDQFIVAEKTVPNIKRVFDQLYNIQSTNKC